jgi:hypothetical protein
MSTNSLLLLDPQSVHDMHIDVPRLVTQSISDVAEQVRMCTWLDALEQHSLSEK